MVLQSLAIYNLFGFKNVNIPFYDNKIILVGENGAGKTTILRILYLFLAKQWKSLNEYDFEKMEVCIDNVRYEFICDEYEDESISETVIDKLLAEYPDYEDFLRSELPKYSADQLLSDDTMISGMDGKYDIPISLIYSILNEIEILKTETSKFPWKANVIYLPTYRRIERDYEVLYGDIGKRLAQHIQQLFPEISYRINEEKNNSEFNRFSETENDIIGLFEALWTKRDYERWSSRLDKSFHLELIEFGMDDVRYHIQNLIVDKQYEKIILNFLEICNRYITGHKKIVVIAKTRLIAVEIMNKKELLPLESLSAGEKQILSLFSYLLKNPEDTFLIIDEPELSLSILWQEMILADIIKFNVGGLIVATHSPFTITSALKKITHGINELVN